MKKDYISHIVFKIILCFCELRISLGSKKQTHDWLLLLQIQRFVIQDYEVRIDAQMELTAGMYRAMLGFIKAAFSSLLFQSTLLVSLNLTCL